MAAAAGDQVQADLRWAAELVAKALHERFARNCGHSAFPDGVPWDELPPVRRDWWVRTALALLEQGIIEIGPDL